MPEDPTEPGRSAHLVTGTPHVVRRALPATMALRMLTNLVLRGPLVFLPELASGVGASRETLGAILGVRELSGLSGPYVGSVVDRGHQRTAMVVGTAAMAVACAVAAFAGGPVLLAAALLATGFCKLLVDTGMNAWVAEHTPFGVRGRVVGLVETTWAGSYLLGVPLMGGLIGWFGWRSPFAAMAAGSVACGVAVAAVVGPDRVTGAARPPRSRVPRQAWPLYLFCASFAFGHHLVFASSGAWLTDAYGLTPAALGLTAVIVGGGELVGSAGTVWLTDRLGKVRSVVLGVALVIPAAALLGVAGARAWLGLGLFATVALAFEFGWISMLPLLSEVDEEARGASIGAGIAMATASRAAATYAGVAIYQRAGIGAVGLVAAGATVVSLALVARLREPR